MSRTNKTVPVLELNYKRKRVSPRIEKMFIASQEEDKAYEAEGEAEESEKAEGQPKEAEGQPKEVEGQPKEEQSRFPISTNTLYLAMFVPAFMLCVYQRSTVGLVWTSLVSQVVYWMVKKRT